MLRRVWDDYLFFVVAFSKIGRAMFKNIKFFTIWCRNFDWVLTDFSSWPNQCCHLYCIRDGNPRFMKRMRKEMWIEGCYWVARILKYASFRRFSMRMTELLQPAHPNANAVMRNAVMRIPLGVWDLLMNRRYNASFLMSGCKSLSICLKTTIHLFTMLHSIYRTNGRHKCLATHLLHNKV